jgi:hypothetical protein
LVKVTPVAPTTSFAYLATFFAFSKSEDSDVMDTPLRKAMRDAGMKESDFR